jgi:CxxC motif-containing protein (DUF1111 family)
MKTIVRLALILGIGCLVLSTSALADLGDPIPGLTADQQARFTTGKTTFEKVDQVVADGLGPLFNEASCATCHGGPSGGSTGRLETRFGSLSCGVFDPLANEGGSLMQDHAIGKAIDYLPNANVPTVPAICNSMVFVPEVIPDDANVSAQRRTTFLFGLGFVDALPPDALAKLADLESVNCPDTAGMVSYVTNADTGKVMEGRFGWKAQNPTLHAFSGDAYINEMGVTNPSFPTESCPQGDCSKLACNPYPQLNDDGTDVGRFTDFMTMLAPPPRGPINSTVRAGEKLFDQIGCTNCHTPTLETGPSPFAAIDHTLFHPYSDFLLHDMGSLGDGITQNTATGNLMKTAPLWGLRFEVAKGLLHDGSATTLEDAIEAHDGQAEQARASFFALRSSQQNALLAFLSSL